MPVLSRRRAETLHRPRVEQKRMGSKSEKQPEQLEQLEQLVAEPSSPAREGRSHGSPSQPTRLGRKPRRCRRRGCERRRAGRDVERGGGGELGELEAEVVGGTRQRRGGRLGICDAVQLIVRAGPGRRSGLCASRAGRRAERVAREERAETGVSGCEGVETAVARGHPRRRVSSFHSCRHAASAPSSDGPAKASSVWEEGVDRRRGDTPGARLL